MRGGVRDRGLCASSDGLLHWLSEACWARGSIDLLTEREAEQARPPLDPELEALVPF